MFDGHADLSASAVLVLWVGIFKDTCLSLKLINCAMKFPASHLCSVQAHIDCNYADVKMMSDDDHWGMQ